MTRYLIENWYLFVLLAIILGITLYFILMMKKITTTKDTAPEPPKLVFNPGISSRKKERRVNDSDMLDTDSLSYIKSIMQNENTEDSDSGNKPE